MATIENLNKSISEMSEQELIDRMLEIRKSRRTSNVKKSKAKSKPKASDPIAYAKKLSSDARAKLIAELEEME